jgi:hypothetical protein
MVLLDELLSHVLISNSAFCYRLSCKTASALSYKHQPNSHHVDISLHVKFKTMSPTFYVLIFNPLLANVENTVSSE